MDNDLSRNRNVSENFNYLQKLTQACLKCNLPKASSCEAKIEWKFREIMTRMLGISVWHISCLFIDAYTLQECPHRLLQKFR